MRPTCLSPLKRSDTTKQSVWMTIYYIMPYNSQADVVRLLAERCDTKTNDKAGRVSIPRIKRPTSPATLESPDTTKLSVCG